MPHLTRDDARAYAERVAADDARTLALVGEEKRAARIAGELSSAPDGPLHGIPVGVKDIFHADGLLTRAGSRLPPGALAGPEASCVAALKRAGAVVAAKTVTCEFAFFDAGPTRNPRNPDHTPGGSSSGSAAGVAAGLFPLAIGTQTIGSVIRPAAFCGVIGFKPSFGRIATDGVIAAARSADTVGIFAADLPTLRTAARVMCDGWREHESGDPPRVAVPDGPYLGHAEDAARALFEATAERLCAARVACMADFGNVVRLHRRMVIAEAAAVHASWFARYAELYGPGIRRIVEEGRTVPQEEADAGRSSRTVLRRGLETLMDERGIDVWICPAATGPAPHGLAHTGDPVMNLPWTHAGMPAITLPDGAIGGLPVGLQCVARHGHDEELLSWASSIAL